MPIGEIAGELLGGFFRVAGHFLVEIVFEICVRGVGYWLCKPFSKTVDPEGIPVVLVGLTAWLIVFVALYVGYDYCNSTQ